jgi:hypothetical protein
VVVLRGLPVEGDGRGSDLVRSPESDLYGGSER